MKLAAGTLRYLWIDQAVVPAIINVTINFLLGILAFRGQPYVATWSLDKGAALDSIGTCFFLPFITCLIATPIVRHHVARGKVEPVPASDVPGWARWFTSTKLLYGIKFGTASLLILVLPVYAAYLSFAGDEIETLWFICVKAMFAGLLGFVVTPIIAFIALCNQSTSSDCRRT